MAKFCSNCGKEVEDVAAFCPECGTPITAVEQTTTEETVCESAETEAVPVSETVHAPVTENACKENQAAEAVPIAETDNLSDKESNDSDSKKSDPVSTGYYFWMRIVYSIPVIGWILCIIFSFAGKNKSKKHFALATLIRLIIGIVIGVALYFLFKWISGMIVTAFQDWLNETFGTSLENANSIMEIIEQFQ